MLTARTGRLGPVPLFVSDILYRPMPTRAGWHPGAAARHPLAGSLSKIEKFK
jgi:hypothetical protein